MGIHVPFPLVIRDVHDVVRFVSRSGTLPSQPGVQCKDRLRKEIWLGQICCRRGEFQDQFEVNGIFVWRFPFQSRRVGVSGKHNRENRQGVRKGMSKIERTCFGQFRGCRGLTRMCRSIHRSRGAKQGCRLRRPFRGDMKGSSL